MTRKDCELIARELHRKLDSYQLISHTRGEASFAEGFGCAVESIAIALKSDNPRFDEDRFLKAVLGD